MEGRRLASFQFRQLDGKLAFAFAFAFACSFFDREMRLDRITAMSGNFFICKGFAKDCIITS